MGIFDRFPYSSTHEMNLDFMLGKATEIAEDMQTVATGMAQVQAGLSAISEKTEQATQAAAAAAQSASSIEGSVTAAEEAAEEAQMHNESAQTWANNAMTYKADCQRSATEAAASSSSAAQAATAAAASEDTVAQYAQAANASAQSAANNNDSAHQYANQASASASNATFHSSNAQTAATNANTSATNAETAATNAQTAATRTAALKDDCETLHSMCVAAVDQAATEAVNAANSAAQAAATKTDVETLVESLPEDFTDLNNTVNQLSTEIDTLDGDVTDLKSALTQTQNTIDKTKMVDWKPAQIVQYMRDTAYRVDGTSFTSGAYFSIKFIPAQGKIYRISTSINSPNATTLMCACLCFDSSDNVIGVIAQAGIGETITLTNKEIIIPNGTAYVICTNLLNYRNYALIEESVYINATDANAKIDETTKSLNNYPSKTINTYISAFEQGLRHNQTNAALKYDTSYLVSANLVSFKKGDILVFDLGSAYILYLVDATGDFIATNITADYTFAADASAYVEIKKSGITQADVSYLTVKTGSIISGLIDDIDNVQDSFASIEPEVTPIDFVIGYDSPTIKNGYHVINGQETSTSSALSCCGYIDVKTGDVLLLLYCQSISKYSEQSASSFIANIGVSSLPLYSGNEHWNMWVADFNGYIRVTFYNDKTTKFAVTKLNSAPYHCVCLGDSIMGNRQKPYDCPTYIQNVTNVKTANCGFGGTRASTHDQSIYTPLSFWSIADAIATGNWEDIDIDWNTYGDSVYRVNKDILINIAWVNVKTLFVHYGTNDWSAGAVIDNLENKYDKTTYKGALRYGIERILGAYPNITIILSSPLFRYFSESQDYSTVDEDSDTKTNIRGNTLPQFVSAMKDISEEYHLPFIDNYAGLGMNKFNAHAFLSDGTHPSYFNGIIKIGTEMGGNVAQTYSEPRFAD